MKESSSRRQASNSVFYAHKESVDQKKDAFADVDPYGHAKLFGGGVKGGGSEMMETIRSLRLPAPLRQRAAGGM